jgi:hypothetical protein
MVQELSRPPAAMASGGQGVTVAAVLAEEFPAVVFVTTVTV